MKRNGFGSSRAYEVTPMAADEPIVPRNKRGLRWHRKVPGILEAKGRINDYFLIAAEHHGRITHWNVVVRQPSGRESCDEAAGLLRTAKEYAQRMEG